MSKYVDKKLLLDHLNTVFANLPYGAVTSQVKDIYNAIDSGHFDTILLNDKDAEIERLKEESAHYWNVMLKATADNERLTQEIERLRSSLEWYADDNNYTIPHIGCVPRVMIDRGSSARVALSHQTEQPAPKGEE